MRATIGNMEATIAPDGRSIELAPPGGERPAVHLSVFEATATSDAHAAGAASKVAAPTIGSTDALTGAGAALVISALAVGFVLRRGFASRERATAGPSRPRDARPDDEAERVAFMKRYGGAR